MNLTGNRIQIQQGETWAYDARLVTADGHPFCMPLWWKNPYLVMTITSSIYDQKDSYREVYWLDLGQRYFSEDSGVIPTKKFAYTKPLYLPLEEFEPEGAWDDIQELYPNISLNEEDDMCIKNFLFYIDPKQDGNYVYNYVEKIVNNKGTISLTWAIDADASYDFRFIKQFDTSNWSSGIYLFDVKIVDGDLAEPDFEEPLKPGYKTQMIIQYPTEIYVGTNIQRGV